MIRGAVPGDAEAISGVAESVFLREGAPMSRGFLRNRHTAEEYKRIIRETPLCLVAEEEGKVVGFLTAFAPEKMRPCNRAEREIARGEGFVYVSQVGVRPEWAGKGIGTALYVELLRETGGARLVITISSNPPNEASARFHNKFGFVRTKEVTEEDGTKWGVHKRE